MNASGALFLFRFISGSPFAQRGHFCASIESTVDVDTRLGFVYCIRRSRFHPRQLLFLGRRLEPLIGSAQLFVREDVPVEFFND